MDKRIQTSETKTISPEPAWFTDDTCTVAHSEVTASLAHEAAMQAAREKSRPRTTRG